VGQFFGVEIDVSGAGDHLEKVDIKIRRLKETIRSVQAGLPWKLPSTQVKHLVYYATSRNNARRTTSSITNIAPRVAFTGRKINYKKEFALAFGDYCECYDPKVESNNTEQDRTEPCTALYPTANAAGSWTFLNLKTNKNVRRTNWVKMVTNELVIKSMNAIASNADGDNAGILLVADDYSEQQQQPDVRTRPDTHVVIDVPEEVEDTGAQPTEIGGNLDYLIKANEIGAKKPTPYMEVKSHKQCENKRRWRVKKARNKTYQPQQLTTQSQSSQKRQVQEVKDRVLGSAQA
jgi:hypothetical protein